MTTPNPKLSNLESLPVELIEKIFLYSLNTNLPRASPHLAAALSSEQIYRLLILLAFFNNDEVYDLYELAFGGANALSPSSQFEPIDPNAAAGNPLPDVARILHHLHRNTSYCNTFL